MCVLVFWLPAELPTALAPLFPVLLLVLTAGLLLRSRWSIPAFLLVATATLVGALFGITRDPFVAAAWTLYPVALRRGSTRSFSRLSVVIGLVIAMVTLLGTAEVAEVVRYSVSSLLVLAGAWALGSAAGRERREAEQAVRAETEHAVVAERLRVVREVHDVVSHSLGAIALSSSVGAHLAGGPADGHRDREPDDEDGPNAAGPSDATAQTSTAAAAPVAASTSDSESRLRLRLSQIETTSRQALDELRVVLGSARGADADGRRPQPGIGDLTALVAGARNAGTSVNLVVSGPTDVAASTALAVYRLVQEGLTNAARHAAGALVRVVVAGGDREIRVEITDDGLGTGTRREATGSSRSIGYGLVGLRERVELLGGVFAAGPDDTGGFAITAILPVAAEGGDGRIEV
ncbi:signal transduction histidine kinase [Actinoalloteichus hymeniacidonis]|uniref:histidine kinase n=1 Tax=Actinoalloteichus hymeniacidonis TaxID=340345 RepID=A0AAC9MXS3_9PSEU|nr:signal transduction histidine kinase [Actinoalloteichus hymeniacidonis]